jgi:HK97 family phage major capsid protein
MSKLAQLRERRTAKAKDASELNAKYPADKRMPKEDIERMDALLAEIEDIDGEIKRETRLAQLAGEQTDNLLDRIRDGATREPGRHSEHAQALRAYFLGGLNALSDQQRQAMSSRQTDDLRQFLGQMRPQGAMSTTTPAEGGYTTAPEYMRTLEAAMKAYGGMLDVATILNTAGGADMNFPTTDATAEEGEIVGQNVPATTGETTFGNTGLATYRYSSKKLALPWELLQDTFLDLEAYINGLLGMRLGRIGNKHWTIGTGTGQPRGIVTASTVGKTGTTGQTLTVTYDDLVDLEHSVNSAYRALAKWMFADSSLKVIRKIKDSEGRPMFAPGYEAGNPGGAPDRLLNRPIVINDDVPAMAANAKSILFGDFKKYWIRKVMDLTLFRMTDSAFTLNGQVGFVAFQRMGGNYVDVGGAVKHYANSAT